MSENVLLEKVSNLLESAKISINTVDDYIEFYRTGKLPEPFDIPAGTELPFRLEPVKSKPQASHLDSIRNQTVDILIRLDILIDEVNALRKIN